MSSHTAGNQPIVVHCLAGNCRRRRRGLMSCPREGERGRQRQRHNLNVKVKVVVADEFVLSKNSL